MVNNVNNCNKFSLFELTAKAEHNYLTYLFSKTAGPNEMSAVILDRREFNYSLIKISHIISSTGTYSHNAEEYDRKNRHYNSLYCTGKTANDDVWPLLCVQ